MTTTATIEKVTGHPREEPMTTTPAPCPTCDGLRTISLAYDGMRPCPDCATPQPDTAPRTCIDPRCDCRKPGSPLVGAPAEPEFEKRWNTAIDIVLNSGLLFPHIGKFWAFCDGEITEDELRDEIR